MLRLDHLTVIAPTLTDGVGHVGACLGLDVPFGQRHGYMGTHNHLLQLGDTVYLEIVALDPEGEPPPRARWFGLDDQRMVRADWDAGRRLRGWVARVDGIDAVLAGREQVFGRKISLPWSQPAFDFAIPDDGSLPLGGAAPSLIDRRGKPRSMATIADLGARLCSFALEHPEAEAIAALYGELAIDRPPAVSHGDSLRYRALIDTPAGQRELF
ncbi:riboflavin deaminase [Bosea sp. Root381]|uniref:VOC family protein n=1 Tax=Bosea sp. Root381 TaxID=1736524 RepID=UPI0006FB6B73|nr:VOC family protein [Bosea sp. Root381]KRE15083.1 riboflavin deaminase [Bosea sp. Root381]